MSSIIKSIEKGTPADRSRLKPGDEILAVNGKEIIDVLDYKYYEYDEKIILQVKSVDGRHRIIRIRKQTGEDLGIEFETYLMDKARACANRCVFCFVDQMPRGMRRTLYFKDDDARLSFLTGNYITLTNLSEREIKRIISLHISPINISVHATNPELRKKLLRNERGGEIMGIMRRFAKGGIEMNCQIVCCPGLNDGGELERSMMELSELYPQVNSVSVVPVGLTKYREHLTELHPFTKQQAEDTIKLVTKYSNRFLKEKGSRIFFCSDELYIKAELPVPADDEYEGYPQLENGVGLIQLLEIEFDNALKAKTEAMPKKFAIATGISAKPILDKLIDKAKEKFPQINGTVYAIRNDFFGETINVAGLVTGGDLIAQLKEENLGDVLFIPQVMLRHGEGVFLDDLTIDDVERELSVKVMPIEAGGEKFADAVCGDI